jgi:2-isopropylmalate synthase
MTRIAIYDTTLRDGSQGEGVNFSLQDKLLITGRLDDLGVDYIEGGYPLSNPRTPPTSRVATWTWPRPRGRLRHDPARDIAAEDDAA